MSITDSNNNSHQTLPLTITNSSAVDDMVVKTDPHTTSEPLEQASGDVAQHIVPMASDSADSNGVTAVGSPVPTVPPLESIEGAVVEAQSSSLVSGDDPEERWPHTTSVSSSVETDPHTTSEPLVQASGNVAQHIASMASDCANDNGLTAVGSQVPTVPPLESIEGAVVEAQSSSSVSGDAPEENLEVLDDAVVEVNLEVQDDFLQSQAVDDMVVETDPVLYDAVVEPENFTSGPRDAPEERRPPQIPLDPELDDAVVEVNLEVQDDFLQSQAVDDMVVETDPVLYNAVVEPVNFTSGPRDAPEERRPPQIPLDPELDDAVVEVNLEVQDDILQSQAVDDMVVSTDPMLYDAMVEAQISSSGPRHAPEERRPPRIPLDPKFYDAVVEGKLEELDDFLHSQDLLPLDGVTIGDNTVLHIAASSNRDLTWQGTSDNVDFAREVYLRNRSLLTACNKLKETPLHCAAKAGNYRMVNSLISFAEEEDISIKQTLLRARNIHGETALHEAVRVGHGNIVNNLILHEPSITGINDVKGVSPLYLATMMNAINIVELFTKEEPSRVSCAGPEGQTALHVAVLEYTRITRTLLEWNKSLATKVDDKKSTPLHYAASVGNLETVKLLLGDDEIKKAAYMADKNGLFPIHTAAKCGEASIIKELIKQFPDSDELLDTQGRNILHLAIQSGKGNIIFRMRHNHTFLRMLNARDYQENTPLHLAGATGQYHIVRFLISMKMVYSSIMNRNGLTPVDLALKKMDRGFRFLMGKKDNILRCMMWMGALPSPRRADHIRDDLKIPKIDKEREIQRVNRITRNVVIISVLIATVTFAAIFTMPGGYIADDHMNRGTPILSRKYAFKAFIVADLLAFLFSMLGTGWLIYAASGNLDIELRQVNLQYSTLIVAIAAKATLCAFALAIYTMIYQVNLGMSIVVCVASFGLLPFSIPYYKGYLSLVPPIKKRIGWRGFYKSHLGPWTSMCSTIPWIKHKFSDVIFLDLLSNIFLYGCIFGLALI